MTWKLVGIAMAAVCLSACTSSMSGDYVGGKGKTLPITKEVWAGYNDYVAKIQGTNPGAFVVAALDGVGVSYTDVTCSAGHCRAGKDPSNWAMEDCQGHGFECVLFARSSDILINYKIIDGQ
ncbi:MAG TPA: hypothetical protein VHE77_01710 [Dongiaceae bacterium]|nr:hypothetical protein [Dongiaceae bacterium]